MLLVEGEIGYVHVSPGRRLIDGVADLRGDGGSRRLGPVVLSTTASPHTKIGVVKMDDDEQKSLWRSFLVSFYSLGRPKVQFGRFDLMGGKRTRHQHQSSLQSTAAPHPSRRNQTSNFFGTNTLSSSTSSRPTAQHERPTRHSLWRR